MADTHSNALGWLLDQELGEVDGVKCAVLVSGDGLLQARTRGIEQDYAEKLAALSAPLRAAGNATSKHIGGGGVRQHLIEFAACFALTTAAANNAMLSVVTTGTDADVELITRHMVQLAVRLGHAMEVEERRPVEVGSPT
ncbi:roadblock/LC7 domain-containing protein (plasmid) [Streptomyces sp. NBC_00637]|jgi:predicted regulator of Ras-like GTPase activity (Roadblock/LC7/MglB family)|uniref:roadblock/LC7 domain-containing protein n=1 Tax=Streptomyces sp. NBC_00637 TaxID=2903667 RepID=UPI002F90EBA8